MNVRSAGPLILVAMVAILAGCGNGGASEPPVTSYDPAATSKLQFAAGIATLSYNGGADVAYGLNTVETLRQKDGLSGVLYSVPMIIGPTDFAVVTSTETGGEVQYAGADLGTNHITWGTLNQVEWTGPPRGSKASSTGAFGFGLCPCNSDSGPQNGFTPLYQAFFLPIYGNISAGAEELWYGGPPAFPAAGPTVRALGWEGYSLGFTDFAVQPVLGKYNLYTAVPPSYDTPQNPTPSPGPNGTPTPPPGILATGAQLTTLKPLPVFSTPAFEANGKGGGTVQTTVPRGVSEALVVIRALGIPSGSNVCEQSHSSDVYYTLVTHKTGVQKLALADNLGPVMQTQKTPTLCADESYYVYAVGADWPLYEASYPASLTQLPVIKSSDGQADITTSSALSGAYP